MTDVEARELPVVTEVATTMFPAADAAGVPAACVVGVLIPNEHEVSSPKKSWVNVSRPAHQVLTGGWCSGATHSGNLHISATCTNEYIQVGHMQCGSPFIVGSTTFGRKQQIAANKKHALG
ncbi:unnamed protein product [Phytophthora fragariaefolia]|uniref:Unnamed protein product n=1 Tax=Phytophthora fragariaefolia TaxID=1490495 RepID=A0A9W7D7Y2_9STRA|nr:unnamed protein product [Phytophthora fragariaefolia]